MVIAAAFVVCVVTLGVARWVKFSARFEDPRPRRRDLDGF